MCIVCDLKIVDRFLYEWNLNKTMKFFNLTEQL